VTLEKTLRTFRDFHLNTRDQADDIALSYLFSGNNNVDEAIGLAWIGAICRSDGFDVGVTTPSSYADLLVTPQQCIPGNFQILFTEHNRCFP